MVKETKSSLKPLEEILNFLPFIELCKHMKLHLIGGETSLILSPDSEFFKFFGNIKPKSQ